jgi:hypothetical protein
MRRAAWQSFSSGAKVIQSTRVWSLRSALRVSVAVMPVAVSACSDCAGVGHALFNYSVLSESGENLTNTAFIVVRRLAGNPLVPVDSVRGLLPNTRLAFEDTPGTYRVTISHEGYVSQDRTATVVPGPDAGDCGTDIVTQDITVTLVPLTG